MGKRMLCVWERRKLGPAVATVGCFCFSHLDSALCREDSPLITICSVMCGAFGGTSLNPVWAQGSGFIRWPRQEWGWPAPLSGSSPLPFRTPAAWMPAWTPSYQPTALLVWCQIQREEGGVGRWSSEGKRYCVRSQAYVSFSVDFSVDWKKKMWSGSGDVFYSGYNFNLLLYQVSPPPTPSTPALCICRNNFLLWDFYIKIRLKKFY